ncbi:MAG: rRNA pseudouridine synthase [Oscillospiraceae bacterium]|nr:rRNA pseudouridine synthase [Oscillospiraceae bacterium]
MERLDKIISACGAASRREVKTLVKQGRVRVDGVLAAAADMKVEENTAVITLDGVALQYSKFCYVLLHKPAGVLSATEDRHQKTVLDLLPEVYRKRGLAPVGRLDKDTEGLLLLTDDGELTHRLLSPKYHVDKVYYARVEGTPDEADRAAFAAGIPLSDFTCLPAELTLLGRGECLVTVREGKFHQVKRMLGERGKPVTYLKRLSMGPLHLEESLSTGQWRLLEKQEVLALQKACGLACMTKE